MMDSYIASHKEHFRTKFEGYQYYVRQPDYGKIQSKAKGHTTFAYQVDANSTYVYQGEFNSKKELGAFQGIKPHYISAHIDSTV